MLVALSEQHAWSLSTHDQDRYAVALEPFLVKLPVEQWQSVISNYHLDHKIVLSLGQCDHPQHTQFWEEWCSRVIGILRHSGQDWAHDSILDIDDLAQVARIALVRALPGYSYRSRFSSWAYSVIQRSVRDSIRASQAQRRSANTTPLDDLPDALHPTRTADTHEELVQARLLAERIATVLRRHPDSRLVRIFQLWAIDGRSSAEIGELFKLHGSRVRALLHIARELLSNDPEIQAWYRHAE